MIYYLRRRFLFIFSLLILLFFVYSFNWNENKSFSTSFKIYFSTHSTILLNDVLLLFKEVEKKNFNPDSAKILLLKARIQYKSIEPFVIAFFPGDARRINKIIIPEMEEDDELSSYVIPHGFQYVEKLLYNDSVVFYRRLIKEEVEEIYTLIGRFNESISYIDILERDVFDAMQMHLVRQFTIGLINMETSLSRFGTIESAKTIFFYKELFREIYPEPDSDKIDLFNELYSAIDKGIDFLNTNKIGSEPDYFTFYSKYYIPVSDYMSKLREVIVNDNSYNTTAINFQVRSIFDLNVFNSYFFLPAKQMAARKDVIELGRTLFFDPALSANNLRACASCHQPVKGFTDGLALSQSFEPGKNLSRNAPTVLNSVLQRKLFYDGRVFTFEDQAGQVMSNPLEMHNDFSQVAVKLKNSPKYLALFKNAFLNSEDTLISSNSVLTAIAEYERSLIGMNSKFDKAISGRGDQLTEDEKNGFNLFMGKGNCASCHFIPLFNGVMPPEYVETEWEILGVPSSDVKTKRELDADIGRAGVINVDIFKHAFKSPTLRNIELTGPYMHNGVFKTLEEVIEFYNVGGGTGLGYEVPFQTLASDSLQLSPIEKYQLISFLKTLTDTVGLTIIPSSLPEFSDNPKLNFRPIGGDY